MNMKSVWNSRETIPKPESATYLEVLNRPLPKIGEDPPFYVQLKCGEVRLIEMGMNASSWGSPEYGYVDKYNDEWDAYDFLDADEIVGWATKEDVENRLLGIG